MMKLSYSSVVGVLLLASIAALTLIRPTVADDSESPPAIDQQAESPEQIKQRLTSAIRARFGLVEVEGFQPSEVDGLYELFIGGRLIYMTESGRYLVQGVVLDMFANLNITERSTNAFMNPRRQKMLAEYPDNKLIIFASEEPKYQITVATDISCGYCRKFHREIQQLIDADIKVRYMLFPRSGLGLGSHSSMISVWCSDQPDEALTLAKAGQSIASRECENPIEEHFEMARSFGVTGTPTIFLNSGEMISGYVPADELIRKVHADSAIEARPVSIND